MSQTQVNLDGAQRLLFVRLGRLGDLMTASWLFKALKAARPGLSLSLLTLPACRELLAFNRDLDEVRFYRRLMPLAALAWTRWGRFDALVDLNDAPSTTSSWLSRLSGVKLRAAFRFEKNRDGYDLTVQAPPPESSHILERLAKMAEFLGVDASRTPLRPCLQLGEEPLAQVRDHLKAARPVRGLLAAFNLSAGRASRLWTAEGWLQLGKRFLAKEPSRGIVILSKAEDRGQAQALARELGGRVILPRWGSFQHFAAYIHEAGLLVSPDTSAVHIASAFQRPVVGLYPQAPWNLASWRPYGTANEVLVSASPERGEFKADEVFESLEKLALNLGGAS